MQSRRHKLLKQEQSISELRERVSDILQPDHDDYFLLSWLRARNFDLDKSEEMLRSSMLWREKVQADRILQAWTPPDVLLKYFAGGICGYDRENCPIYIVPAALIDMKGFVLSAKKADILLYDCYIHEMLRCEFKRQSQKFGHLIDKVTLVIDLENFSMKHLLMPGMDVLLQMMGQTEANYPETLKTCYVVNAPMIFPVIYKACKPFMSDDTKKKIVILGPNWKEKLQEEIDPGELPQHWGGTATDPDGDIYCRSKVCMGGDIPESFHIKPEDLVDKDSITVITVPRSSTRDIELEVKEMGKVIRWVFWSEGYDIKFKVSFKLNNSKEPETLKPLKRIDCHLVPEDGILECSNTGTYILTFDNTYSWLQTKKISYSVELLDSVLSPSDNGDTQLLDTVPTPSKNGDADLCGAINNLNL